MRHAARVLLPLALALASLLVVPTVRCEIAPAHRAVLVRTSPAYPELARRMHLSADVVVRVDILPDGTVASSHAESGHFLFRQAAEDAVRDWRFAPAPITTITLIHITFNPN